MRVGFEKKNLGGGGLFGWRKYAAHTVVSTANTRLYKNWCDKWQVKYGITLEKEWLCHLYAESNHNF